MLLLDDFLVTRNVSNNIFCPRTEIKDATEDQLTLTGITRMSAIMETAMAVIFNRTSEMTCSTIVDRAVTMLVAVVTTMMAMIR